MVPRTSLVAVFLVATFASHVSLLQAETLKRSVVEIKQAVDEARAELRHFQRTEFPSQMRRINSEIKLRQAEIDSLKRRLREYQRFKTNALFATIEDLKLLLLKAELDLRELRQDRILYQFEAQAELRERRRAIAHDEALLPAKRNQSSWDFRDLYSARAPSGSSLK